MSEMNIEKKRREIPPDKAIKLILGALLLGVLFNVLFYKQMPALSIFLFTTAFYILYFYALGRGPSLVLSIENLLLLILMLLAVSFAIHSNMVLYLLNLLIVPTLIISHTILFSSKNTYKWHTVLFISDIIIGALSALFLNINKPFLIIYRAIVAHPSLKRESIGKKIVMGILTSIPILFIIIGLLTDADEVFKNIVVNFTSNFHEINLHSFVVQLILILLVALFTFSYLYSMIADNKINTFDESIKASARNPFCDPIIVITVLSMLSFIYLVFISIQFSYLFSSVSLKLPNGITYAEYARHGFFELVMVTVLNVFIIVFTITMTKTQGSVSKTLLRIIDTLITGFTFIMLFSAHFRMNLYQKAYGFTYLRFFTHYFMLYIALLLIIVLIRIWYNSIEFGKFLIVLSLITYTALNFINVDRVIVNNNIAHYKATGVFDISYVYSLSYDSVPELIKLYKIAQIDHPAFENELYTQLLSKKHRLKNNHTIQSYNYSAEKARRLLSNF